MRVYLYYILLATYIGVAMRTRARVRTYARTSDYFAKNPTIENQYLTLNTISIFISNFTMIPNSQLIFLPSAKRGLRKNSYMGALIQNGHALFWAWPRLRHIGISASEGRRDSN